MHTYKLATYSITLFVLFFGFFLFYSDTHELLSSWVGAILSAALVWISFVMIGWLIEVFIKPKAK